LNLNFGSNKFTGVPSMASIVGKAVIYWRFLAKNLSEKICRLMMLIDDKD
jgi:hypothetical protein